ncbi:hypothetical protein [Nostoc sp.]|uniref:hypothetical protein n=1 Tax=Nostoc sp. TaxID=1180 RepID=UPI002FF50AE1
MGECAIALHPSFLTGAINYIFGKPTRRLTWIDTLRKARGTIVPVVSVSSVVYCPFIGSYRHSRLFSIASTIALV